MALALGAGLVPSTEAAEPAAPTRHVFTVEDSSGLRELRGPQLSPDGQWIAYTVRVADVAKDKFLTDLWMSRWDGSEHLRLTQSGDVAGGVRWSPDGRFLSFLAARAEEADKGRKSSQVWRFDRRGGDAQRLTDLPGNVADYAWSPDGQRLVLAVDEPDPREDPEKLAGWMRKTAPPVVIDRLLFKKDREGYLGDTRSHLHLFDLATRQSQALTTGRYSEGAPAWSPDGQRIAFLSKRGLDPDRGEASSLFVMEARADAPAPLQLASFTAHADPLLAWSPDGRQIAFLAGDEQRLSAYHRHRLAVVPAGGGAASRLLTEALDRGLQSVFAWLPDGRQLLVAVDDDRASYLARVDALSGALTPLTSGRQTVSSPVLDGRGQGRIALLAGDAKQPAEVQVLEAAGGSLRRVSRHNEAWLATLQLGETRDFTSVSKDGTQVNGLISTPPGYTAGRRYPTLLLIHGGPNGQDAHALGGYHLLRELLTARGYVVLQVNYRGSSGRGDKFQKAIVADWGNKEVVDLLGAVDWAVAQGIADPARLGLGGWSYGGILSNYTIASDGRFKAAVSGAGSSNQLSMFGTDQYVNQYERELGAPWQSQALWLKLSYPFFKAERIKTPTLFLAGEKDFNVPVAGSEQMYQALKLLGVDTQLVIYPGQFHSLGLPSYQRDMRSRFADWFDRYLQPR